MTTTHAPFGVRRSLIAPFTVDYSVPVAINSSAALKRSLFSLKQQPGAFAKLLMREPRAQIRISEQDGALLGIAAVCQAGRVRCPQALCARSQTPTN